MNTFKDRLSKKLRQAVQKVIGEAQSDPAGYVEALVNETIRDIRKSNRDAVLLALGIDTRWSRFELQDGGLLEQALKRGPLVAKLAAELEAEAAKVVLSAKERKDLLATAREMYMEELDRRVRARAAERVGAMVDAEIDALIDEMFADKEPSR